MVNGKVFQISNMINFNKIKAEISNYQSIDTSGVQYFKIQDQSMYACCALLARNNITAEKAFTVLKKVSLKLETEKQLPGSLEFEKNEFRDFVENTKQIPVSPTEAFREANSVIIKSLHENEIPQWFNELGTGSNFKKCTKFQNVRDEDILELLIESNSFYLYFYWE